MQDNKTSDTAKNAEALDLRVKRTRRAIRSSFFALLKEKDFEKISVKDITDLAMISRNTFYLHYADKYELLDSVCDRLLETLYSKVAATLSEAKKSEFTVDSVAAVIRTGIVAVIDDREAYSILLRGSASDIMTAKLHNIIYSIFETLKAEVEGIDGCTMEYIVSGMTGVVKYYVYNDAANLNEESKTFTLIHLGTIIDIVNRKRKR